MLIDMSLPRTPTTGTVITRRSYPVPGTHHTLDIITADSGLPGPTLGVIGAVHGDELEGPLAISQLLQNLETETIHGTLILLPVANPCAVAAGSRNSACDGQNLARVFPGRMDGTPTEAMAALITEHVIRHCDGLIDLHSAGVSTVSPLLIGYTAHPGPLGDRAANMAHAFGADVVWSHPAPMPPGRTLSAAETLGVPGIYTEATGGVTPLDDVVDAYAEGVIRVMQHLNMISDVVPETQPAIEVTGDGDTDSPTYASRHAGLLDCHVTLGRRVEEGQLCYTVRDVDGSLLGEVHALQSGYPVFLRRARWVEKGVHLMSIVPVRAR